MAVEILIKQKKFFKKGLSLKDVQAIGGNKYEFGSRDNNTSYVFQEFNSSNLNQNRDNIVLKNKNNLGRGFFVTIKNKDLYLVLNVPTTNNDIEDFYEFVAKACQYLKTEEFTQDDVVKKIPDIESLKKEITDWNSDYLKSYLSNTEDQIIVFGVNNPIYIPEPTRKTLLSLSGNSLSKAFADYLHERQALDLFYMKPVFYDSKDGKIMGVYPLTETVDYIVPKEPFVPYPATRYLNGAKPESWNLSIVFLTEGRDIVNVDFNYFIDYISKMDLEDYDNRHWILRNTDLDFIDNLLK